MSKLSGAGSLSVHIIDLGRLKPEACVLTDFILFSPTGRSDDNVPSLRLHRGLSGVHSSPGYFTLYFPLLSVRVHFPLRLSTR